jgi:hypothetical protein
LGAAFVVVLCGIVLVAGGGFEARGTGVVTINFVAMRPTVVVVSLIRAGSVCVELEVERIDGFVGWDSDEWGYGRVWETVDNFLGIGRYGIGWSCCCCCCCWVRLRGDWWRSIGTLMVRLFSDN